MPKEIVATEPKDKEWIIVGAGRARYQFRLTSKNRIIPRSDLMAIKVPDSTPEILAQYSLDDEQALLAKVRYNRLIDLFLELNAFSLQNHLRTTVKGVGQIEIDELYVGVDKLGRHHVIPVQAKGGTDQISAVQTGQDISWCSQRFPALRSRAISAQFMADDVIAIFELGVEGEDIKVIDEKHYRLVVASDLVEAEITQY